jgi:preprotein translocase subunit SecD
VDANILIFERTKEELKKGASREVAIAEGFDRAWPSIRDSNITTIITSLVLYYLTSSFIRGFALSLLIGVLISMFTAITITRNMMRLGEDRIK